MQEYRVALAVASIAAISGLALANDKTTTSDENFQFEHVSCTGAENEIRVVVKNVKKNMGQIAADLYPNKEDGFLKSSGRLKQVRFAAKSPQTHFCFKAPAAEKFAIAVYHDENANKKFDKGAFGLPAEPYGISNNPKIRFGPPAVSEAIFTVANDGANVEINLKN